MRKGKSKSEWTREEKGYPGPKRGEKKV